EPAAAGALRAGAGAADRLVLVERGAGHRVVGPPEVQAAAEGVAAGAAGEDSGAARAGEGQVAGVAAAGDGRRPAEDLDGAAAGGAALTPGRAEGAVAGDGQVPTEVPAVDGRRNPGQDGAALGVAPSCACAGEADPRFV